MHRIILCVSPENLYVLLMLSNFGRNMVEELLHERMSSELKFTFPNHANERKTLSLY